jgi:chlorophyll synthase
MTKKTNAGNLFLGIIAVATVRNFLEFTLEGQSLINVADPLKDLKTYFLHFTSFYFLVYVSLSLIFYAFALKKISVSECFKIGAFAMTLVWVGPVFGYITSDPFNILYPTDPMGVVCNLHHIADPSYHYNGFTKGMRLEVMLAGLGAMVFLYYKTKHIVKSVLGGICISSACLAIGLSIPFITQYYEYGFNFGDHELYNSILLHQGFVIHGTGCKIALFYIFVSLILFAIAYYVRNPQFFRAIVGNFRWTRTTHYLLLFLGGMLYVYYNPPLGGDFDYLTTIWNHPIDLFGIFMASVALFLSFQSAVIYNDIHDYNIDVISNAERPLVINAISLSEYRFIGKLFAILSLTISFCISETFFFFVLLYNLMAFLYSAPPFRLRQYFLVSNLVLATIFLVAFHAGASVLISEYRFSVIPPYITYALFIGFVLALTVKDSKDYEGDKKAHIQTLYTLFGIKAGNYVTTILVCLATLLTPILLHLRQLLVFSITISFIFLLIIILIKNRNLKEYLVTSLYFIFLCVLSYFLIF